MEYFVDFWLVAVVVSIVTLFAPILVKADKECGAPTWKQSSKWSVISLVAIGAFTHLTIFIG